MLVHNVTVRGRTSRIDGIDLVQGTSGDHGNLRHISDEGPSPLSWRGGAFSAFGGGYR